MTLDGRFEEAAATAKRFTKRPTDDELLKMYGLFKQATVGENNTVKPGLFDLKGRAKWEAWNELQGKSQDQAKEDYVVLVEGLSVNYL